MQARELGYTKDDFLDEWQIEAGTGGDATDDAAMKWNRLAGQLRRSSPGMDAHDVTVRGDMAAVSLLRGGSGGAGGGWGATARSPSHRDSTDSEDLEAYYSVRPPSVLSERRLAASVTDACLVWQRRSGHSRRELTYGYDD